jgi:hypothetical protein
VDLVREHGFDLQRFVGRPADGPVAGSAKVEVVVVGYWARKVSVALMEEEAVALRLDDGKVTDWV